MCSSRPALEVIVTDAEEAWVAAAAGADRLELVAEPGRGGISPSIQVVEQVRSAVDIPVHVMVREHDNGFCYDQAALQAMIGTAKRFIEIGADGLVFGALTERGDLDDRTLSEFLSRTAAGNVTFHRAFDACANPRALYEHLAGFPGVARVLTAGAAPDAPSGVPLLRELIARNARPIVLVGGGITHENLRDVLASTGAREIHVGTAARTNGRIDPAKVRRIVEILAL